MSIESGGEATGGHEVPQVPEFPEFPGVPGAPGAPEWGAGYGVDPGAGHGSDPGSGYGSDPGSEPTAQFDAFRARQQEERAEQATQGAYTFPPEYAAGPDTVFVPPLPTAPPPGTGGLGRPTRSVLIFAGAVVVACLLGLGAWMAFGSSSPSADASSTGAGAAASPTATATGSSTGSAKRALTFRVTIQSLSTDSFTGTVLANGDQITVTITANTRFGTKAHALTRTDLNVGETVIVRGKRTGTDAVTASAVEANVAKSPSASASAVANTGATSAAA